MTRPLLIAAAVLALVPGATVAQTGYGAPSPGQYRAEQRRTANLNDAGDDRSAGYGDDGTAVDDGADEGDAAPDDADRRYADDRADYDRARADYRTQSAQHRVDLARWRARVAACDAGERSACAGYEERYGSYSGGRYTTPAPAYRGAGRYDDYRRSDDYDDGRDGYPGR